MTVLSQLRKCHVYHIIHTNTIEHQFMCRLPKKYYWGKIVWLNHQSGIAPSDDLCFVMFVKWRKGLTTNHISTVGLQAWCGNSVWVWQLPWYRYLISKYGCSSIIESFTMAEAAWSFSELLKMWVVYWIVDAIEFWNPLVPKKTFDTHKCHPRA